MGIKIVTDSTSYLPEALCAQYDISIVSLNVIMNDVSTREVDLSNATFYDEMAKSSELPTSSQPIPEEMLRVFEDIAGDGHSIIGIFLSSDMSGTYQSAHLIREMVLEKHPEAVIHLVDSRSNCMQMGFAALEGAKCASEGGTLDAVLNRIQWVINNSQFVFTPDTLDYLRKGGRIGSASALLGNLLQIKPILTVADGKTSVLTKVRTKKKAVSTLLDSMTTFLGDAPLGDVMVHHINCEEEGMALAKALEERIGRPVILQSIGPVIGLHVGPGSIGLVYYKKSPEC